MKENLMTQPKPTFSVNMQAGPRTSRYGRELPHYRGTITAPGGKAAQAISLWSGSYQDAQGNALTYWNGTVDPVSREASAFDQIHARAAASTKAPAIEIGGQDGQKPLSVEDGRVILFQAKHKDGNIAANGNRRADVYGYWNNKGVLVEIGAYVNAQEGRLASLVGKTQMPLDKQQNAAAMTFDGDEVEANRATETVDRDTGEILETRRTRKGASSR